MTVSGIKKLQGFEKTNEQEIAYKKLLVLLDENNEDHNAEISLAICRLMFLDVVGVDKLTLKMVYDILPVVFDKYIEKGFMLTDNEKNILLQNKEKIIPIIKPYYWDENGTVCGYRYQVDHSSLNSDIIDGFGGGFNLSINDFIQGFKK